MADEPEKDGLESADRNDREALAARYDSSRFSSLTRYLKGLDIAKKALVIVMAACGLTYVVAMHRIESLPSWQEPGIWREDGAFSVGGASQGFIPATFDFPGIGSK